MDFVLRDEIKMLMQSANGPCVSIFMPTHRAGTETQQDPIRFKNLLRSAEEQLIAAGLRTPEAAELLNPARSLLEDGFFWRQQADGLAVFAASDLFRTHRLPIHFEELAVVYNRFHLNPLFPLFIGDGRFYVLALSQKQVRLLECTRFGASDVVLEGVPTSIDEALKYDDPTRQVRFHTRVAGAVGRGESMFRGHGTGVDDPKTDILRYFLKVSDGVQRILRDEQAPLVLAGVDYLLPIYVEANTYPHLLEGGVTGSPDELSAEELRRQAWAIVQPHFQGERQRALARYMELAGTGLASSDLGAIVPAALFGRVESLLFVPGVRRWGTYDERSHTVAFQEEPGEGGEDLVDLAAIHTFLNGGAVYAMEPGKAAEIGATAAVFRY